MGKPPAFQMYAADFDMDTGSWTNPQVGVYIRLLLYSWVNGSIPNNMAEMARIARTDTRTLAKMWRGTLAKKWKLLPENMYVNPRLEIEREKQSKYIESQRQKGVRRSERMWEGHIAVAKKRLQPKDSSSSSTSSSIKNKTYTDEFLKFYAVYPKKVGKEFAWKAWLSKNGKRPPIDIIVSVVEKLKKSDQWSKDGGQFIPNPATWLNRGGWEDQMEVDSGRGQNVSERGSRVQPAEWKGEGALSEADRLRNIERARELTDKINKGGVY